MAAIEIKNNCGKIKRKFLRSETFKKIKNDFRSQYGLIEFGENLVTKMTKYFARGISGNLIKNCRKY